MQTYVLDANLQPVAPGMVGKLYLGGEGLASGYLNRPETTARRFIPHPFSKNAGERLYQTGDLARSLPDGNLALPGQPDYQGKTQEIPVEPGEIETVLGQYPGMREVVVLAREDRPGEKHLVAYIAGQAPNGETTQALRQYLRAQLPQSVVPIAFLWLDALPLTPHGKVDLQALPPPQWTRTMEEQTPQTPIEARLAEIWAEVLSRSQVGRQANFFELGGHSLLATRILARVRTHLHIDLPVRALFEAPILADLAQTIAQHVPAPTQDLRPLVQPQPQEERLPLAYEQEQLWFLAQLEPASALSTISLLMRLSGPVQLWALQRSLDLLLRRHDSLRTSFSAAAGRPFQVIAPAVTIALPCLDLSPLAAEPARQQTALSRLRRQAAATPFDLAQAPLLRVHLVRLGPQRHALLLHIHHLLFDGWSQSILVRELAAFYQALLAGSVPALPPLPIQYADYVRWQRAWLQGETLAAELAYWQAEIQGAPTHVALPTRHPQTPEADGASALCPFTLPATLTARLKHFARHQGSTLYMLALAGWEVVLSRTSGQDDFLVGTPMSTRRQVETEGLISMLVNTLAIRADVRGQPTGQQLLQRVRARILRAQAHPGLPLEKLVAAVQPARQGSAPPLLQVVFAWEDAPPAAELGAGLRLRTDPWASPGTRFDLTCLAWEAGAELSGLVEYNPARYEPAMIQRLVRHWQRLLADLAAQPERPIGRLRMVTEPEWEQQVQWGKPARPDLPRLGVHELVEIQARMRPQASAVSSAQQDLTYEQLNTRANRLAHYLRSLGVRPETRVGLCLERSIDLIVSMLAVLKAGGAYVPLDLLAPAERLAFVLRDARVHLVLSQTALCERVPRTGLPLLCLDTLGARLAGSAAANMLSGVSTQNLASLLYTSGSTGQPKGIGVTHGNIVRLVSRPTYVPVSASDVLLHLAPVAFDASTFEIWGSLANGARLVLAPPGQPSLQELAQLIREQQVSVLWLTAGFFHQMVELHLDGLRPVKQVLAGGEALSVWHVRQARERLPHTQLINGYGPTENTTFSCCYAIPAADPLDPSVPIGTPIAATQAYVLDAQGQPVPSGVVGELYLGGEGLARGYLNRPDLTAACFVPDPWGDEPGARLYRTGDLVRWQARGVLEYVGRSDGQVKVRGYRVECGEIEHCLQQYPGVHAAVVVLREDRAADQRLVAYLSGPTGVVSPPPVSAEALRRHLLARVPEYMVPAAFVWLGRLPLTPHGKVDRRALPAPRAEQAAVLAPEQGPQTPLEEVLAGVWCEVLGVRQVSRQANFFELGGHSLLATQLIARIRSRLRIDIPLRALFEAQTLAGLADALLPYETLPGQTEAIARLYLKVHAMSAEELEHLLKEKKKG
ncbi:MAG TPA: amino acid adenylation domain-containing protein [Ktedonobacteraceae bacterium]